MKKLVVAITGTAILAAAGFAGIVLGMKEISKEVAKEMGH